MYYGGCKLVILELQIAQQCEAYGTRLGLDIWNFQTAILAMKLDAGERLKFSLVIHHTPGSRTVFNYLPSIAKYCQAALCRQETTSRGKNLQGRLIFFFARISIHSSTL